ncbi:MAG: EF-hand domain-containing protein [Pseudomonadota bacterium]|nr:EF-hand domain-containing protein [Pseudomonadota bacterium]
MSVQLLTDQDWNESRIMSGDGKITGAADGHLTEDEYVHSVQEATGNAVSEEDARTYFREMTANKEFAEGEQPYLTATDLGNMKGEILDQMKSFNKSIGESGSLFGAEGTEEEKKAVFDKMDINNDGDVDKNEFISYIKNKALNGAQLSDQQIGEMFDTLAASGNGDDSKVSFDEFDKYAESMQQFLNDAAATPMSDMEKITKMFERLMFQLMTGSGGQGNLF